MGLVTEYIVGGYHTGRGAYVWRSSDWSGGGRLVVHCHPAGGSALSFTTFRRDMARIVAGGAAIVVVGDLAGTDPWANDPSLLEVDEVIAWAETTYDADVSTVSLLGDSMGGLTALNWGWRHPDDVAAIVCRLPVVALDAFHDANRLSKAAAIEAAYGGLSAYNAAVPTHDPSASGPTAALEVIADRVLMLYADDDPIALASEVTALADATGIATLPLGPVSHGGPNYYGSIPDVYMAEWLLR